MKYKELAKLNGEERGLKRKELELELIKMNTQVATGTPPKNAGMVSRLKKDIAKILLLDSIGKDKAPAPKTKDTGAKIKKEESRLKKNE
jgi:ribosomal protein L29